MNYLSSAFLSRQCKMVLAAVLVSVSSMAAAQNGPIAIKHVQGETTIAATPKKVVVFDLAALDIMKALDVKATAVPTSKFPASLAEYAQKTYPKVGTLFEPNYEAVFSVSPDLIIVAGRSAPKYAELGKIAPTIDLTVDPKDLVGSVIRNTRTLAKIYHKEEKGEALIGQLNTAVKNLHDKAQKAGPGLIVLTVGGKMSAYGPGSRFGVIHDTFGVPAAIKDLATTSHGQSVSFEFIHKINPKWLFVIDRDAAIAIGTEGNPAKQLLDNDLIRKTDAAKDNHIVYLDSVNWYLLGSAGITALMSNIQQVSSALDKK